MQHMCHMEMDPNDFPRICILKKKKKEVVLPETEWGNIYKYKDNNVG